MLWDLLFFGSLSATACIFLIAPFTVIIFQFDCVWLLSAVFAQAESSVVSEEGKFKEAFLLNILKLFCTIRQA